MSIRMNGGEEMTTACEVSERSAFEVYEKEELDLCDLRGDIERWMMGSPDKLIDYVADRVLTDVKGLIRFGFESGFEAGARWLLGEAIKASRLERDVYGLRTIATLELDDLERLLRDDNSKPTQEAQGK